MHLMTSDLRNLQTPQSPDARW